MNTIFKIAVVAGALAFVCSCAFAQQVISTTAYTRGLLATTNAASAQVYLGQGPTNGLTAAQTTVLVNSNLATNTLPAGGLAGALNFTVSTNAAVSLNDLLEMTNQNLQAYAVGGVIASRAQSSNAVVLAIGDSFVDGIGFGSALSAFAARLQTMYGHGGKCGRIGGWGGGWYNLAPLSRTPPTNIWPAALIGLITPADNTWNSGIVSTSAVAAFQGSYGANESNYVNAVGVCYNQTLYSTGFAVTVCGPAEGYTNRFTVNDNGALHFEMTNIPVPLGCDYSISVCSLGGTNYVLNADFINTNHTVTYFQYGFAGYYVDSILGPGSNYWAGVYQVLNPDVVLYHSKHLYTSTSGSVTVYTNTIYNLLGNVPSKTCVELVSPPPDIAEDMWDVAGLYRQCCVNFGWFYGDLWGRFPSLTNSLKEGLLYDGQHPSLAGIAARSAALCDLNGAFPSSPGVVDFRLAQTPLPQYQLPPGVITNHQASIPFVGLNIDAYAMLNGGVQMFGNFNLYENYVYDHYAAPWYGIGSVAAGSFTGGSFVVTNTLSAGTNSAVVSRTGSLAVTNSATVGATNFVGQLAVTGGTAFPTGTLSGGQHVDNTSGHDQFIQVSTTQNLLIWTNGFGNGNSTSWYVYGNEGFPLRNGWSVSITSGSCNYQLMQ